MIKVKLLSETAKLPSRANPTDAGLDLVSDEIKVIPSGTTAIIKTGIAMEIPTGYVGKIEDRSSMAMKGLRTGGGVVDSSYRGEVKVVVHNLADWPLSIEKGQKIAQMLIYPVSLDICVPAIDLSSGERGDKGFGSSG